MPKQEKVGSSHKYVAFPVFFATWDAEPAGKLLTMRENLSIIGLGLRRSASKKVSKHAGAPFMKLNEKSRIEEVYFHLFN